MVDKTQFTNGMINYIDNEVMNKLPTVGKWTVGTMVALAKTNADQMLDNLIQNPILSSLNLVDHEGMIDVDKLAQSLKASAMKYGDVAFNIPLAGTLRLNHQDVDVMKQYIERG